MARTITRQEPLYEMVLSVILQSSLFASQVLGIPTTTVFTAGHKRVAKQC